MAAPEPAPRPAPPRYETCVGSPGFFLLNQACLAVREAFGQVPFLVGSATFRKDWRDVDVRLMLADDVFEARFPGCASNPRTHALWSLTCSGISLWLSQASGLPVDFQVQRASVAAERYALANHTRIPLGFYTTTITTVHIGETP